MYFRQHLGIGQAPSKVRKARQHYLNDAKLRQAGFVLLTTLTDQALREPLLNVQQPCVQLTCCLLQGLSDLPNIQASAEMRARPLNI